MEILFFYLLKYILFIFKKQKTNLNFFFHDNKSYTNKCIMFTKKNNKKKERFYINMKKNAGVYLIYLIYLKNKNSNTASSQTFPRS